MKTYEVRHRCKTFLTVIDEDYKGGAYPYCKKCGMNVRLTGVNEKTNEFKFKECECQVLVPTIIK